MRGAILACGTLLVLALSGCSEDKGPGFDTLVVRLRNQGTSALPVPFTVQADGEIVFAETLAVGGGATVERTIPAVRGATHVLHATYKADSGGQQVSGERTHVLETHDCREGTVLVTFSFIYSSSAGRQQFNSGSSAGSCLDE